MAWPPHGRRRPAKSPDAAARPSCPPPTSLQPVIPLAGHGQTRLALVLDPNPCTCLTGFQLGARRASGADRRARQRCATRGPVARDPGQSAGLSALSAVLAPQRDVACAP